MNRIIFALVLLISTSTFAQLPPSKAMRGEHQISENEDIAKQYAETITADELRRILTTVASDEMEGRETATAGQKKAEAFIVSKIKSFGIPPIEREGVTDGYLQEMPFTKEEWGKVEFTANGEEFKHLRDFYCFRSANNNMPMTKATEIVFLGYGIDDEAYSDYKGVDVKGKVIMILADEPMDSDGKSWITKTNKPSTWTSNWKKKLKTAKDNGVKAVLIIDTDAGKNIGRFRRYLVEPSMTVGAPGEENLPTANNFYISPEMARALLGGNGKKLAKARKKITKKGKSYNFTVPCNISMVQEKKQEAIYSTNIMAFIEGSDDNLKEEIVVISAHYDHLGKRGNDVYNGADDNGSGTTALIELAQAYAQAVKEGNGPRRSVLLLWMTGEEKGLLGSEYYVNHPIFPLENTIVDVNVDMIGRVDKEHTDNPKYIYVIGADRLSSELHEINEEMNAKYTNLKLDYTFNEEDDPNRYYYRSDHYNFAELGIPAIFYFSGVHDDYHQITDTVDKIQFEKMETIARLVFHTSWELANRENRIVVDKQ
ncbi:MAG: M28 family peptidase [Saprospiraceae bacterium]|nr:M28 family peptidase [Saprospiraceae bacterium]